MWIRSSNDLTFFINVDLRVKQVNRRDSIRFTGLQRNAMNGNLEGLNPQEYSARQERHAFAVFVFYPTAEARSGEYTCEWGRWRDGDRERGRERERVKAGWIKAEQLPTPLKCEHVVTSLSISIFSHQCANAGVVFVTVSVFVCVNKPCAQRAAQK